VTFGQLPGWATELIESARVARLALLDSDDRPRVLPITFALAGGQLWSAIDQKPKRGEPARLRYLRRRPEVAVCVDHYDDDWAQLAWVQLLGRMDVIAPDDGAAGMAALIAKYEQYRESPPPGPLLRMTIERTLSWRPEA
jgi:PPOX class probable F420-dependent enzyme